MRELADFAHVLKERRRALDLTQRELADRAGCTVSTIAKLESAERRPSKQLIDLLADALSLSPADRARIAALGRAQPRSTPSGGPAQTLARPALVGRSAEWRQLQQAWERACAGEPHLALLTGGPGIGKTRLAGEVLASVQRAGCPAASAQAFPADATLAYRPAIMWLRSDDIRVTLPRLDRVWLGELARLLPELLEERGDLPVPGPLTQTWQRGRFFEALARAVLADKTARLLVLDDLQWCDAETLDWLSYLLRFDAHAPLLVVATQRREELTAQHPVASLLMNLTRSALVTQIELGPLDAHQSALLAAEVIGHSIDPALASYVYSESEGNPLFIIEIARAGKLATAPDDDSTPADPSGWRLPPTVYAVMVARLAQVPPRARDLVDLAAVVGQAVSFDLLRQTATGEHDTLAHALDELCRRGILREVDAALYDFTHHKLREVAYAELGTARRRTLHERIARALEAAYAHDLDQVSVRIGAHYEAAYLPELAVPHFQRAADAARRLYANSEALEHLRRALSLVDASLHLTTEQRQRATCEICAGLGDLLELSGRHEAALGAFGRALTQTDAHEALLRSHLHRKRGKVWEVQRRYHDAAAAYQRAEEALGMAPGGEAAQWWQAWLDVQLDRMWLHFWQGQWADILALAEHTRQAVLDMGSAIQRARFFHGLTLAAYRRDRFVSSAETLTYCQAHLRAALETGDPSQIGLAHYTLGYDLVLQGTLDEAERELQAALDIAERIGDVVLQARCLIYLARVARHQGNVERVRHFVGRCLPLADAGDLPEYVAMAHGGLAWIAWREGGSGAVVREQASEALRLWRQLPIVYSFQWAALLPLMAMLLDAGEVADAVEHARTLLDPAQQRLPAQLTTALEAAVAAWGQQQVSETQAHLTQAVRAAQQARFL